MILQGPKSDTNTEAQAQEDSNDIATTEKEFANEVVPKEAKPKQRIKKPTYLNDFV